MKLRFHRFLETLRHPGIFGRDISPWLYQIVQAAGHLVSWAMGQPMTARLTTSLRSWAKPQQPLLHALASSENGQATSNTSST